MADYSNGQIYNNENSNNNNAINNTDSILDRDDSTADKKVHMEDNNNQLIDSFNDLYDATNDHTNMQSTNQGPARYDRNGNPIVKRVERLTLIS